MKLDIIIVDFILVTAVIIPYLLFILIGRKEEAKLKNKFLEEASKHGFHLEETDRWNNNIIGLDREKAKILLLQKRKTGIVTELIDLKQVRACHIYDEVQPLKIDKRTENVLLKLGIQLSLQDGSFQILNLYNCEETYYQDYELKHAEKWHHTINALLVHSPTVHFAA